MSSSTRSVADRLHSASIHLLRRIREVDKEAGVPPARLSALSVLVFGGPRSIGGLAAIEQVRQPTMTRIVQGLERAGLARRRPDPDDRRAVRVSATPVGRKLLQAARRRRVRRLEQLMSEVGDAELRRLERGLQVLERLAARPAERTSV